MANFLFSIVHSSTASLLRADSEINWAKSQLNPSECDSTFGKRRAMIFSSSSLVASLLSSYCPVSKLSSIESALGAQLQSLKELPEIEEDRVVQLYQDVSPSVVSIVDLELFDMPMKVSTEDFLDDQTNAKITGAGSGFIWDKFGHIVTNYHVVEKLASDTTGSQRCKVFLVDRGGVRFQSEGKIIGFDPSYDLAILKANLEGHSISPAALGRSSNLRVGQRCFAIGNPYGFENTLTSGIVSGLNREIPSPNGRAIRGVIQTDAAINSGNSGGPLIDSSGHVIGVNTATFTKKGTGKSSGINFAIPIDAIRRIVPNLIVYGTAYSDRF